MSDTSVHSFEAVLMLNVGSVVENWAKEEKGQSKSVSY